jgi:hypothetical protein
MNRDEIERRREERWERRRERWARRRAYNAPGRQLMAVLLIAAGVLFILRNFGILYFESVWSFWPVILIVMGLSHLSRWRAGEFPLMGALLTGLGAVFLMRNLGLIDRAIWGFVWPGVLILVGVALLFRHTGFWRAPDSSTGSANRIDEWVIFGGVEKKITSQEFEGGEAFAMFGGVELDLRQAATKKEEIVIDASAMFGGVEIRVPETWAVTVTGAGIFGGFEDGTSAKPAADEKRPRLVVTGHAMFGGVEVRN